MCEGKGRGRKRFRHSELYTCKHILYVEQEIKHFVEWKVDLKILAFYKS
jgi:hypothetical protein